MIALEMRTSEYGMTLCDSSTPIALHGDTHWEQENLKPYTDYVVIMIEKPAGTRLVTDEERQKYKKPSEYWYSYLHAIAIKSFEHEINKSGPWNDACAYLVRTDHVWEEDRTMVMLNGEVITAEEAIKRLTEMA